MNALMLRGVLKARGRREVRVMTAIPIPSVAEPFIRLRAQAHLKKGYIVIAAGGIGQPYVTTDYPSVQRALELEADALIVAKQGVDGVYTADPRVEPHAHRYDSLSFSDAISNDLRVMDPSAFILARDHGLTLHVFDVEQTGAIGRILDGDLVGTEISNTAPTKISNTAPTTIHQQSADRPLL
jgi:uridylate kinase